MATRIEEFARQIIAKTIRPEDIPEHDRRLVQECLLRWTEERRKPRTRWEHQPR